MIAACAAAECGHQVTICEKNDRLGRKLFITGKGRCNITNACDMEGLFDAVLSNPKFLYSSFYGFSNQDVIDFLRGSASGRRSRGAGAFSRFPTILRM